MNVTTVPNGVAGSMMNVVVAIGLFVRPSAIGPVDCTWLNATQNAVVQVRARRVEQSLRVADGVRFQEAVLEVDGAEWTSSNVATLVRTSSEER